MTGPLALMVDGRLRHDPQLNAERRNNPAYALNGTKGTWGSGPGRVFWDERYGRPPAYRSLRAETVVTGSSSGGRRH